MILKTKTYIVVYRTEDSTHNLHNIELYSLSSYNITAPLFRSEARDTNLPIQICHCYNLSNIYLTSNVLIEQLIKQSECNR